MPRELHNNINNIIHYILIYIRHIIILHNIVIKVRQLELRCTLIVWYILYNL